MSKHQYLLSLDHDDMLTLTLSLTAAIGIVIEDPPMFEAAVRRLTRRYDNNVGSRVIIAQLIEKLHEVHIVMRENGECDASETE